MAIQTVVSTPGRAGKQIRPPQSSPEDFELRKYSVILHGHKTSVSLERVFWNTLSGLAQDRGCNINRLIEMIDAVRTTNLSSAIRVFVMRCMTGRSQMR